MAKSDLTSIIMFYRIKGKWMNDVTRRVLQDVKQFSDNYELIIIESVPTPFSEHLPREIRKEDTYLTFEENLFTSKSLNLGVSKAKGKYIFYLANDVVVHPNWLSELVKHYYKTSPIKALGPTPDRVPQEQYIEDVKKFKQKSILWPRTSYTSLHGGFFMEKAVFEDIGGFDENFGFYFVDRDFDQRFKDKGYQACQIPTSMVTHLASMTWFYTAKEDAQDPLSIYDQDKDVAYFQKKWGRNP